MGEYKVLRRGLHTKKPGNWEVYDIINDRGETTDLASQKPELLEEAKKILAREVRENQIYPLRMP